MTVPFQPVAAQVVLAAGIATGATPVAINNPASIGVGRTARVYNQGTEVVFLKFGASDVVAALNTSTAIAPGSTEVFGIGATDTHAAAITAANTSNVYIQVGDGI